MEDKLDIQRKTCEAELQKCMEESLLIITDRMRHMGLDVHSEAIKWFSIIKQEVSNLLSDLVTESEERERVIMEDCVQLLKRAEEYCKALEIPMEPYGQNEERNLRQEKVLLNKRLEEYEVLLQSKRKELANLQKRNVAVSKVLDEEPIKIDETTMPSYKQLQRIQCEIDRRDVLRFEREELFIKTKENILKLLREYDIQPVSEFQMKVIQSSVDTFVLSEINMKLIEEYFIDLTQQSIRIHEKVTELRLKVRSLWDVLTEDIQKCDEFTRHHPGFTQSTLEAFRVELHRCEDLRKENIERFIEKVREEIVGLWDKCHVLQDERDKFHYFKDTFYNEDLLELHEREREKLQQIFDENKNMLAYLEEHEQLWKKVKKLVDSSDDPKRLFNRGGQLLKEEKERNAVERKIPLIDAALIELANAYENTHGKPFRSFGKTIQDIIDEKHENREQEKKLKLSARKMKKSELTPGKSSCTLSLARSRLTPDMKSTTKRRLLSPRNATTSKKTRVIAVHKRDIQKIPMIKINDITHDISMRSAKRRNRIDKTRRLSDFLNKKEEDAGYNEFSVQLCKPNLRSTLLATGSDEVLAQPLEKTPPNPSRSK